MKEFVMSQEVSDKVLKALTEVRDEYVNACEKENIVDETGKVPSLHICIGNGYVSFFSLLNGIDDDNVYGLNYAVFDDQDEEKGVI